MTPRSDCLDACKSYDVRISWYYSPQISISSLTFGLRPAAGVLCSGDRSRMRRAARARPPAEAAPKPCYATPSRSLHLFACTPYRVLIIALNLFHSSIDRFRRPFVKSLEFFVRRTRTVALVPLVRRMTSVKPARPLETIRTQCPRCGSVGRTKTFMEDGRCATCEALGRRSLSTKLLQVATAQAHMRTCSHAASPPEQVHDSDLASRALAAKRRKSIAGFKLNLLIDSQPKSTTTEQPRSPFARRNTWCS